MNKNLLSAFVAAFLLIAIQQQANAQFLKGLGKVLQTVGESVLNGATTTTPSQPATSTTSDQPAKTNTAAQTAAAQTGPRYKIHETASTKTITLEGGASCLGIFSCGRAVVTHRYKEFSEKAFVIDIQGNKVFDIPEGYLPAIAPEAIRDLSGHEILSNHYGTYDNNRLLIYNKSKEHAIIYDENGNTIKAFDNVKRVINFNCGIAAVSIPVKGKWTTDWVWFHIDTNGNILSKTMPVSGDFGNEELYQFEEGLAPVCTTVNGNTRWGFRNEKCEWAIPPTFRDWGGYPEYYTKGGFHNGLCRAMDVESKKWGYIDHKGNWVIQPTYSKCPGNFYSDYALVTDKNDRSYFIDKTGKIVWKEPDGQYFKIRNFLPSGYAIWTDHKNTFLVDLQFNKKRVIKDYDYDISCYTDDYFVWGSTMYDWEGNPLLILDDYSYGLLSKEGIGIGSCGSSDDRGTQIYNYYNSKGEIIVKFEDTQF